MKKHLTAIALLAITLQVYRFDEKKQTVTDEVERFAFHEGARKRIGYLKSYAKNVCCVVERDTEAFRSRPQHHEVQRCKVDHGMVLRAKP